MMVQNPLIGVGFHWLGGLSSGSFYVPYRGVRRWSWETYWLVGGLFSWLIVPWIAASLLTHDLTEVLVHAPGRSLFWAWFFGVLWGIGGLTFGLTMRYLGMSLGMAVALGYCAAFGTLIPPIFNGEFLTKVAGQPSGRIILLGVAVCLAGIAVAGLAGMRKEREMSDEQKREAIREFDFRKGIGLATISGVMSACFSYGLAAGAPIKAITLRHGTGALWQGLPVLIVVLAGGFLTNFMWCLWLHRRHRSAGEYARRWQPESAERVPLARNYLFSAMAGTIWYLQFFFYTMGETQMGQYGFSSWTLHMASIIIFSTLWGITLKEWKGTSRAAWRLVLAGLALLITSTVVIGYGNYLATK